MSSSPAVPRLGLFGIDVHILGYACDDQAGAFAISDGTLRIKLAQNKLWAEQSQKQRALLQIPKKARWRRVCGRCWDSNCSSTLLTFSPCWSSWSQFLDFLGDYRRTSNGVDLHAWKWTTTAADLSTCSNSWRAVRDNNPKKQADTRKAIRKLKEALGLTKPALNVAERSTSATKICTVPTLTAARVPAVTNLQHVVLSVASL